MLDASNYIKELAMYDNIPVEKLVERALTIQRILDQVKPLYNELDEITWHFANNMPDMSKFGIKIKDNFAKKNVAWKATGIRRFQLIVLRLKAL